MSKKNCFGFFGGQHPACQQCFAAKRCKAILISHGFDVVGDMVDQLVEELPDITYSGASAVSSMVKQMKNPQDVAEKNVDDIEGLDEMLQAVNEESLGNLDLS